MLFFCKHIHYLDLVADIISFIFRIGNRVRHGRVRNSVSVSVPIALFPKKIFELFHAVLIRCIKLEKLAHHFCLVLINHKSFVLFVIAENTAVAKNDIVFDCLLMPEFDPGGKLPQLVLRNAGHDGKPQL